MLPSEKIKKILFGLSRENRKIILPIKKFITQIKKDENISGSGKIIPDIFTNP
jgi:hypothetical protein